MALRTGDVKICSLALEAAGDVLALGDSLCTDGVNPYAARFKVHDIVDILRGLQNSPDDRVRNVASLMNHHRWGYFDTGN
jgi:hypothetical protein